MKKTNDFVVDLLDDETGMILLVREKTKDGFNVIVEKQISKEEALELSLRFLTYGLERKEDKDTEI